VTPGEEEREMDADRTPGAGRLAGKVVVLTGAAEGLGRAYLEPLAREGAALVINDINEPGLAEAEAFLRGLGAPVAAVPGSVTDWRTATSLVETALDAFGKLDALVNNAAVHYVTASEDDDPDLMRNMVEVNVLGTLYPGVAALKYFTRAGVKGNILNMSPGAASGLPKVASYAASKGAVSTLTFTWAEEFRDRGIRVNALAPAALTQQVRNTMQHRSSPVQWSPDKIPPIVVYFLSDLSRHITGQVVRLWGEELYLVSHPRKIPPLLMDASWTVEGIDAAFREHLNAELQPYSRDMARYVPMPD
jgi:NAD(P)-dependent dehydrogenase (short-subunit alcohol dehydrogenase family)